MVLLNKLEQENLRLKEMEEEGGHLELAEVTINRKELPELVDLQILAKVVMARGNHVAES